MARQAGRTAAQRRSKRRSRGARKRAPTRKSGPKEPEFTDVTTEVIAAEAVAEDTDWIRLERPPGYDWKAGQFTILELELPGGKVEDHMFSIATSPTSKGLEIATRKRRSAFKRRFHRLKPGDKVGVQPADGSFVLDARHPAVFVTGGIGITAVKAMLEYATDKALHQDLTLIYSNPKQEGIAFRDELEELPNLNPRLRIEHTLTREDKGSDWDGRRGRIDADVVREIVPDHEKAIFYVCGPPSMVRDLRKLLMKEVGVSNRRVKIENVTGYD